MCGGPRADTADELGVWAEFPDAAFALVKTPGRKNDEDVGQELHPGAF